MCPLVPIGTYSLSKSTHPLGRVIGSPGFIAGCVGTYISRFADVASKNKLDNPFDILGSIGRGPSLYGQRNLRFQPERRTEFPTVSSIVYAKSTWVWALHEHHGWCFGCLINKNLSRMELGFRNKSRQESYMQWRLMKFALNDFWTLHSTGKSHNLKEHIHGYILLVSMGGWQTQ